MVPTSTAVQPQTARSCNNCPSLLRNRDQSNATGYNVGSPICALKLIPLSRPGGPEDKTLKHFASSCDSFGKEVEVTDAAKSMPIELVVAFPNPKRVPEDTAKENVSTCAGCANYVPPMTTRSMIGWNAGFCRAKGSLLMADRLPRYAAGCQDRVYAISSERVSDIGGRVPTGLTITLLPEYDLEFGKKKKPDINAIHMVNLTVKPSDYDSDAPVNEGHKRLGIRAFRRIVDPKAYGPNILLPIMDSLALDRDGNRIFSDDDIARIPLSGDEEKPEKYFDHNGFVYKASVMWTRLKQTPAVWGPAGVGKTELFRHIAWMMGMPFVRLSITESSELDDLAGKMMYSPDKGTWFQYGRVPRFWKRPNILCVDEPNTGPPSVWQFLRPLTDDSKQLVLDQNSGERIAAHRLCYLAMAMNPAWDPRNIGAAPLADADGSRLSHIWMDLPPADVEKRILREVLEEDKTDPLEGNEWIDTLMNVAKEIRGMSADGRIPMSWGIRHQKKVIRAKRYMSWPDAFRMGVTDSLEPAIGDTILEIVKSYCPNED